MALKPDMDVEIRGISVIGELKWRSWGGAVADLWHARAEAGASGSYVSNLHRLFIVLEKTGGDIDFLLQPDGGNLALRASQHASFIPAGVPLWLRMPAAMRIRHLDVHFDLNEMEARLGKPVPASRLAEPRLTFDDRRVLALARLMAEECAAPLGPDLYGDGLALAMFGDLLRVEGDGPPARRPSLAAWQLRRATAFIEENCLRPIRLRELAEITGLSQSYFSRAFKESTGVPPHRWHMQVRIERAQKLLRDVAVPLNEIAVTAGFADQAHFTRVFREVTGVTPAAWRRTMDG